MSTKRLGQKTKIVCTIGPASQSPELIERLVEAGMNVARLNFSHGTYETHERCIYNVREVAARKGLPIPIMQDLPGQKPRIGNLPGGEVRLDKGAKLVLTIRNVPGNERELPINLPSLPQGISMGSEVLLDDGALRLKVESATKTDIKCKVIDGGVLKSRRGILFPGIRLPGPFLTEQDIKHLSFGIDHEVDFIALSFVSRAAEVMEVKKILKERGADIPLIAKIERPEAVANLEEIISIADGVMVARGDLGVEIPLPKVPEVQKKVIRRCNHIGKSVITATQMLESMTSSASPTRAEVTDVANAIFDGSDAIMLSAETSIGKYPVEATLMMRQIAEEAEAALPYEEILLEKGKDLEPRTDDAISYDACHAAHQLKAVAIIAFTTAGSTALRVSKYRPKAPILAPTPSAVTRRRLSLAWGVYPLEAAEPSSVDALFEQGASLAKEIGVAKKGDLIVIVAGIPIGMPGITNLLKVERIG